MFIRGPKLGQLEERADVISRLTDQELESVTDTVIDWFRSFNDINIARSLWAERVNASLLPLVVKAYDESAANTWEKLTAVEDDAAPALTAALIPKVISGRAEEFFIGVKRRLTAIGDMLWNSMRTELLVGMQLGDSVSSLRDRIGNALKMTAPRARNIASTEVLGASQAGSFHQVKTAKVVALKRWVAKDDDRVRKSHRDVDDVQIDMDAKFIVGGYAMDYPHDPTAPLEETINCRCTLVWEIVKKDELSDELVIQSLAADAFHLPGEHDQSDHGRKGKGDTSDSADTAKSGDSSRKIRQMVGAYRDGFTLDDTFSEGNSGASVALLTLSDGSKVVRKTDRRAGANAVRNEYLAGRVFNALTDADDVTTAQVDDSTLITTHVDGPPGAHDLKNAVGQVRSDRAKKEAYEAEIARQAQLPGGKEIGMLDWLTSNSDRHALNWMITGDGVKPIDQGDVTFSAPRRAADDRLLISHNSPFVDHWLGLDYRRGGTITSMSPRVTESDLTGYRARLERLRPEFDGPGEVEQFEAMMSRLAIVEDEVRG